MTFDVMESFRGEIEAQLVEVYREVYTNERQAQLVAESVTQRVLDQLELADLSDPGKLSRAIARESEEVVQRLPTDRPPNEVAKALRALGRRKAQEGRETLEGGDAS